MKKIVQFAAIMALGLAAQPAQSQQWGQQQPSSRSEAERVCTRNGLIDYNCAAQYQARQDEIDRLNRNTEALGRVITIACYAQRQGARFAQRGTAANFGVPAGLLAGGVYRVSVQGTYTLIGQNPCR